MIGATLERIIQSSGLFPKVRKDELTPGDCVVVRTVQSIYTLTVISRGVYKASGGWFDKKGCSPMTLSIAGATWGGSAIMPQVLAACGLRIEFANRLITSPVQKIFVFPRWIRN